MSHDTNTEKQFRQAMSLQIGELHGRLISMQRGKKPIFIRRFIFCIILALSFPLWSLADSLVVAGRSSTLANPLVFEGDEVLAPLIPTLRYLGARASTKGEAISLITPDNKKLALTTGATAYTVDGRKATLPTSPREIDGDIYLPVRALAKMLNAEVCYDALSKTLTLSPVINISYEMRGDAVAVIVRSISPLQFTSGRTDGPPRLYVDFKHAALGLAEQQIPVGEGLVERLRISQYTRTPSVVRVVADVKEDTDIQSEVTENGRTVALLFVKHVAPVVPIPEIIPPVRPPVNLQGITLSPYTDRQSEMVVKTDTAPLVDSSYDARLRQLSITFRAGVNGLNEADWKNLKDKAIERVEVAQVADDVRLSITLKPDMGYLVSSGPACVRVLMGVFSIADMVVVLDAGHGGGDIGAPGKNGIDEKDVNLDVMLRAAKLLRNAGAKVILSRSDDTFIHVKSRPPVANNNDADVFISVHCNSCVERNKASGTQTYYTTQQSALLAATIHTEMIAGLGLKNGGVRTANYWVTKYSTMPAVLLELAYINNDREEALLNKPEFRQKAAESILRGLKRYAATKAWQQRRADLNMVAAVSVDQE